MNSLKLINRNENLFLKDIEKNEIEIKSIIQKSSFLIIGGAGSIGQSVVKEIFNRSPRKLHVVDLSENSIVELVRDLRSSKGYINGDFQTFAIDVASAEFDMLIKDYRYDYVFNLSAIKHVRNEKDPYTLMRMLKVNILNVNKIAKMITKNNIKKFFCVSTDKAANPVNAMGASKRIMEIDLFNSNINVSLARFANVAFSDGSLLQGFEYRFSKFQPFSIPTDVKRYFITKEESGFLCIFSALLGNKRDIFFPKLTENFRLISFKEIAQKFLNHHGYQMYNCENEDEARAESKKLIKNKLWPCYLFESDTTGEKNEEEFYTEKEKLDLKKFDSIGIIKNSSNHINEIDEFINFIKTIEKKGNWNKSEIIEYMKKILVNFSHIEQNKSLDEKM